MMENSPDPGETEEEEDDDIGVTSSKSSPSLLEEIRMLSQASNNNCSYEGAQINLQLTNICEPQGDFFYVLQIGNILRLSLCLKYKQ